MATTFECKFDSCAAFFSRCFGLSKYESVRKYKDGRNFRFGETNLSSMFTKVDISEKPVPIKENIPQIDFDLEYANDAFKYSYTNENKDAKK